jgi:hypothetical protein
MLVCHLLSFTTYYYCLVYLVFFGYLPGIQMIAYHRIGKMFLGEGLLVQAKNSGSQFTFGFGFENLHLHLDAICCD